MTLPGEGLNSAAEAEIEPVRTLPEQISQLLIDQSGNLAILYHEVDEEWPVIRVLTGRMPSEAHHRMVEAHIICLSYPNEIESTTVILDKMQFTVDSFGATRIDNHMEDPDEEAVATAKVQEIITPGNTLWCGQVLANVKAGEIRAAHAMMDR